MVKSINEKSLLDRVEYSVVYEDDGCLQLKACINKTYFYIGMFNKVKSKTVRVASFNLNRMYKFSFDDDNNSEHIKLVFDAAKLYAKDDPNGVFVGMKD